MRGVVRYKRQRDKSVAYKKLSVLLVVTLLGGYISPHIRIWR